MDFRKQNGKSGKFQENKKKRQEYKVLHYPLIMCPPYVIFKEHAYLTISSKGDLCPNFRVTSIKLTFCQGHIGVWPIVAL